MSDDRPTFGSLFAGIGGIDLGLERAGWSGRWQVEWDGFCQHILAERWPDVPRVGDIHDAHGAAFCPVADTASERRVGRARGSGTGRPEAERDETSNYPGVGGGTCPNCLPYVDLIAGGFPCQPISGAGKQLAQGDDRWLWPEFLRCIRELRPRYVLVENVANLLAVNNGSAFGEVLGGLASLGYDAEWEIISAADVGAPHLRERVWVTGTKQRGALADSGSGRRSDDELYPGGMSLGYAVRIEKNRWPTPHGFGADGHGNELSMAVRVTEGMSDSERTKERWPTPTARDRHTIAKVKRGAGSMAAGSHRQDPLVIAVLKQQWPTPTVQDAKNNAGPSQWHRNSDPLNVAVARQDPASGGQLNPTWVEWLMGFPPGWTDCEHLAMPSYLKSLRSSGGGSSPKPPNERTA